MRTTNSLLFLGRWEYLNNENFNSIEFDGFKNQTGTISKKLKYVYTKEEVE